MIGGQEGKCCAGGSSGKCVYLQLHSLEPGAKEDNRWTSAKPNGGA